MNDFVLSAYAERAEGLLAQTRAAFTELELPTEGVPADMRPDDGKIKLVFVGQYSAGKSSIIKMLSGIDTAIGAGITTGEAKVFDWNGMEIIDTPGIHTGLREDHDDITYDEIGHAALLVFVVTGEGFNPTMAEHFRQLSIEQKRGGSMVLVVNKMDRAAAGNSVEQQEIIRDDMRKVIAPYTPEDLYMSFLAAKYYEMSCDEEDDELRGELLEESGYDVFVANLNAFVAEKGVSSRLLTPLRRLEQAIMSAPESPVEHEAYTGNQEIAKRKLRIIDDEAQDCEREVQDIAMRCQSEISGIGREVLRQIENAKSQEEAEQVFEAADAKAQRLADEANAAAARALGVMAEHIGKETEELLASPFVRQVVAISHHAVALRDEESAADSVSVGDVMQKAGKQLATRSLKEGSQLATGNPMPWNVATSKLTEFSGSAMHSIVKSIGSTLGVKFAPWGAVSIARGAAMLGSVLGVVGVLYNIYSVFQGSEKREQAERESREAREKIRSGFSDGAQKVYSELMTAVRQRINEITAAEKASILEVQRQMEENRLRVQQQKEQLEGLLAQTRALIEEIGTTST